VLEGCGKSIRIELDSPDGQGNINISDSPGFSPLSNRRIGAVGGEHQEWPCPLDNAGGYFLTQLTPDRSHIQVGAFNSAERDNALVIEMRGGLSARDEEVD
jgi:hypothetical protein